MSGQEGADRLEAPAESHGSFPLAWLSVGAAPSLTWHLVLPVHGQTFTLVVVPCSLLEIQTPLGSALSSHSHPLGRYQETEGLSR